MCELEIPALYVKWKVNNTRDKPNEDIHSSSFLFQGAQWKLRYWFSLRNNHFLYVLRVTKDGSFSPFLMTVHVVSGSTGKILPQLSESKRIEEDPIKYCELWKKPGSALVESDPSFRETSDLHFLVVLKVDDALTEISCSREMQTDACYPPEVVVHEKSRSSCTSTSVQTAVLSSTPGLDSLSEDLSYRVFTRGHLLKVLENSDIATGSSDDAANTNPDDAQFINPDDAPFIPDDAHIIPNDGSPGVANIIGSDNGSILENEKDAASSQHPGVKAKSPKISTPHGNRKRRYEELTSAVHELKNISELLNDEEDEYDAFGRFVSLSLRKLSLTSSIEAQSEIQKILAMHKLSHFHSTSHTT